MQPNLVSPVPERSQKRRQRPPAVDHIRGIPTGKGPYPDWLRSHKYLRLNLLVEDLKQPIYLGSWSPCLHHNDGLGTGLGFIDLNANGAGEVLVLDIPGQYDASFVDHRRLEWDPRTEVLLSHGPALHGENERVYQLRTINRKPTGLGVLG